MPTPSEPPKLRLLVVEDDPSISEALCALLDDCGYRATCVPTLNEARALLAPGAAPIVAIVLDMMLPDGSGEELLDELAARTSSPAVIILSASRDAPQIAKRFGVASVGKPFDLDYLLAALRVAIESKNRPTRPPTLPAALQREREGRDEPPDSADPL